VNSQLWKHGPNWLSDPSNWPPDIVLEPTAETMAEARVKQEIFSVAIPKHDAFDQVLSNHALPRVLRIGAWLWRFFCNSSKEQNDGSNQHQRNSVPRAMVNQKGSNLSSPTPHLPSGQTTVEPAV